PEARWVCCAAIFPACHGCRPGKVVRDRLPGSGGHFTDATDKGVTMGIGPALERAKVVFVKLVFGPAIGTGDEVDTVAPCLTPAHDGAECEAITLAQVADHFHGLWAHGGYAGLGNSD